MAPMGAKMPTIVAKTSTQRQREADELMIIEAEKARGRQGTRTDITATLREGDKGEASEKVAAAIGMKARTYEKERKVWEAAKAGNHGWHFVYNCRHFATQRVV